MYLTHFELMFYPFVNDIASNEIFHSSGLVELKSRLAHLLDLSGIGLVTGDPGIGKSTAFRVFASTLNVGHYKVLYVPLSTGNPMDLYKSVAWELGLLAERSRAALYRQIRNEITRLCTEAQMQPVLILDEAHNLRNDVLEEMRLLTNYAMDSQNRLCLLLCGQSELRRRLSMSVHEALSQRIAIRYHLPALSREEVTAYLSHMLRRAGTEVPLFEPHAIEAIAQATKGYPRKINLLAHHALIAAAVAKTRNVTADHVNTALTEVS